MASRDDRVKVTRPDGSETTVSRASYEGVYQYREGWALVEEKQTTEKKSTSTKKTSKS